MRVSRSLGSFRLASLLAPTALVAAVGSAFAADILVIYTTSMQTMLPSSATAVQSIRPIAAQRGVNVDGSLRAPPAFPMALQGNPFESTVSGKLRMGDIRLDLGSYQPSVIDFVLPTKGPAIPVGHSFNARQETSGASHRDSDGYLGANRMFAGQPEILFYDDATNQNDVLYLVYQAGAFVEFRRYNGSSNQFVGVCGSSGVFDYQAGSPDLWVYTDQRGTQYTFLGFNTSGHTHDGLLWKVVDEDGNTAFVGDSSSVSTAISTGWDSAGRIQYAFDSNDRRFSFAYTTLNSVVRLTQVKAETKTGGTWSGTPTGVVEVARLDLSYYGASEDYGSVGDLKMTVVTLPLTDSGINSTRKTLWRYYKGAYDATTNPGHDHEIQYVFDAEGLRRFDYAGDSTFDEDFLVATNDSLKSYAATYLEYDSSRRVRKFWSNGQCGCSGNANGTFELSYGTLSYTNTASYDPAPASRTIVKRPDASYLTQAFDELSQPMDEIVSDIEPGTGSPKYWVHNVTRDSSGTVNGIATPEAVDTYTHSSGAITQKSGAGKIGPLVRVSSGDMTGFLADRKYKIGSSGTSYFEESITYTSLTKTIGDASLVRPLVASKREYTINDSTTTTGSNLVSYAYTGWSGTLAVETVTVTSPAVSTGNNGSNSSTTRSAHYKKDGLQDFAKDEDGHITYTAYTNGQATTQTEDADTTSLSPPSGFSHSGTPLVKKTVTTYDAQGRAVTSSPSFGSNSAFNVGLTYYSRLKDQRLVTLRYSDYDSGTPRFYGPVQYTVSNLAGRTEVSGVIGVDAAGSTSALTAHIDETDDDPITAVDTGSSFGSVKQMSVSTYDELGRQQEEERRFFVIPASGAGVDGTNYDPTKYAYDDSGRRWRMKEASGTIRRTVFDLMGRATEQWIGTNDHNFSGGESSGTDNMVKTEMSVFDGGSPAVGNGLLSSHTLRVQDNSTGERTTTYTYDSRGRRILETPPLAPYPVHKVDNLGRVVATGLYSSSSGLSASTDPTSTATNRMALTESAYDELGRVWKTTRHKTDQADGSDDDTLTALTWYDAEGRAIKSNSQGGLTKTAYDRLGRVTDSFVLAKHNDSGYTDADDVTGDIVLEQHETRYDTANGTVILQASIGRLNTDVDTGETTGALDTDADSDALKLTASNVKGRTQISAMWYDSLERLADRVEYGTNDASANIATFDRNGLSVPARSDTALRTTTAYNTDGTVLSTTDPRGLVMRYEYDAEGRRTKEIRNYVDGTPSGTDDDVTVRYEYTDGLRTKLIADLPAGQTDQETVYTHGTTKGSGAGDSKIATGHLRQKETLPDSSEASDVVTFAYNAQGQEIWKKDQATTSPAAGGNVFETDFDLRGRQTQRRVTNVASGFDGAVRRIARTYDSLGRTSLVTQHDDATVGSGSVVDEVKYSYDNWGNISKFEQDRNSAVSGGGDQYTVSYTWVKATNGRNTLRIDTMTMPSGKVLTFKYRTRNGLHDEEASRVTDLMDGAVSLPNYDYVGAGQVVGTDYPEADVMWKLYTGTGTSATYPDLDRFNRELKSRWTKDLATDKDFFHDELTYDRNSSITSADDSVHAGFDRKYAMDNTDRLTDADEGTLSGGSITSRTRRQQFTLSHTGNWDEDKLDLTGDGDWGDANEWDDCRTHNAVNELTARNTNCSGGNEYTLAYDPAGNMTDDGKDYEYEWDAFYRLRKVKRTDNQALVAEYKYNGLGYRNAVHEDTDTDNDVDASDKWYFDAFDERWRQVARFRESDTSPKEEFVAHQAGNDGRGGASYIDLVACRYKDANTAWTAASDGTLEERVYYCQNQHADVVAIVSSAGGILEWAKYSAYGVPFGLPGGDTNSDGDCDAADATQIQTWIDAPAYDVRGDLDLDGDVDATDKATAQSTPYVSALGGLHNVGSVSDNKRGLAGYDLVAAMNNAYVVRHRVVNSELGRWMSRDSLEYRDGMTLIAFVGNNPLIATDSTGQKIDVEEVPAGYRCDQCPPYFRVWYRVTTDSTCAPNHKLYLVQEFMIIVVATPCGGSIQSFRQDLTEVVEVGGTDWQNGNTDQNSWRLASHLQPSHGAIRWEGTRYALCLPDERAGLLDDWESRPFPIVASDGTWNHDNTMGTVFQGLPDGLVNQGYLPSRDSVTNFRTCHWDCCLDAGGASRTQYGGGMGGPGGPSDPPSPASTPSRSGASTGGPPHAHTSGGFP